MNKFRKAFRNTARIARGLLTPMEKQMRADIDKFAGAAVQEVYPITGPSKENRDRMRLIKIEEEDPMEQVHKIFSEKLVQRQAETSMDASGIFDPRLRAQVEIATFVLLEKEQGLLERGKVAREILDFIPTRGTRTPDPKEMTSRQLRALMDKYATIILSADLIKIPQNLATRQFTGKVRELMLDKTSAKKRSLQAWLYWKRFRTLGKKYSNLMLKS